MANKKISDLVNAASVALTDLLEMEVGGASRKVLLSVIRAALVPINLAADITGILPKANQAAQDMAGDVGGTTAASTIANLAVTKLGGGSTGNYLQIVAGTKTWADPSIAIGTQVTGLAAGMATWLASGTSADMISALTDETGTGSCVFGTAPLFKTTINLNNPGNTFKYVITPAAIAADRILNLPLMTGTDTVALLALAQTLTNKTIAGASNTLTVRIANDVTGLGTNVATFLTTPSGANLAAALTSALPVSKGGTGLTSLTIPASGLLVGTTDTQTVTGKTFVAASNTLTDTSAATGDILRHDGTRFVRLARGSANQVLQTNAGATDIAWATVGGGSLGTNVTSGSEYIAIATGGGAVATAGNIRTPTGGGSWRFRDSTNSVDTYALQCVADNLYIGCDSGFSANQPSTTNVYALAAVALGIGGTTYQYLTGGVVEHWKPAVGSSAGSSPWGAVDGMAQVAVSTLPITLTAAQYSRQVTKFTGAPAATRTITYPLPASDDETYVKTVWGQQTVSSLTITNGGGLTVSIAANSAPHTLLFTTGGVILLT